MREYLTVVVIGDTGAGKSSLANLYLQKMVFKANSGVNPVTTEAKAEENYVDGVIRCVIDTEGLNDGQSINAKQIQNMAIKIRNHKKGINGVVIVLNGQYDRFSQGIKDIIKFVYNSFSTKDIFMHLSIVFTRCFSNQPNYPNRREKRVEYGLAVRRYLSQVSGVDLNLIPEIPIFFVDSYDHDGAETKENMMQFHSWVASKEPLDTSKFVEAGYKEDRVEETRERHSVGFETRGRSKFQKFEDQKRFKIIPNNGDPIRYTEWEKIKEYEEEIEKTIINKRTIDRGTKISPNGMIRYKITVDQEREVIIDPKTNKTIKEGYWYDVTEHSTENGRKKIEVCDRRKKTTTNKKVMDHGKEFVFFPFYHNTTIFKVNDTIEFEIRKKITDFDGNVYITDWEKNFDEPTQYKSSISEEVGKVYTNPKPKITYNKS